MTKTTDIVSIPIHHELNAEHMLYRLQRGTILHIVPGSSLLGRRVAVYCNLPVNGKWLVFIFLIKFINISVLSDKAEFIRKQYLHINWINQKGKHITVDDEQPFAEINNLDIFCELELNRSGSFHFYFTYDW